MKRNAQEVAIEKSDETDGEKKPKSAKTNADAMAELAQKGGQGFACTSMWWGCPVTGPRSDAGQLGQLGWAAWAARLGSWAG